MKEFILALAVLLFTPAVLAERLDDLLSPQQQFDTDFEWTYQNDIDLHDDTQLNSLTARTPRVEIRFNTSPYLDKHARIYIGLPVAIRGMGDSSSLRMSWKTNGTFTNGSITAGNRSRLFEGKITEKVMSDVLDISFQIDARQVFGALRFNTLYEIEILDP